jgi:hypothetical protein
MKKKAFLSTRYKRSPHPQKLGSIGVTVNIRICHDCGYTSFFCYNHPHIGRGGIPNGRLVVHQPLRQGCCPLFNQIDP